MSQVPGLGHVTSYLHATLFHSPLVGLDKETLATCTLSLTREVRRRNKLWQLNAIVHDRGYLSLNCTKESWKSDTSSPHMFLVFLKSTSTCLDRSRLVGFSLIIIHDVLSSHISVGFFWGWPNPFKSSRRYTTSWSAWVTVTNSTSRLLWVTPPCRDDLQEIAPPTT